MRVSDRGRIAELVLLHGRADFGQAIALFEPRAADVPGHADTLAPALAHEQKRQGATFVLELSDNFMR